MKCSETGAHYFFAFCLVFHFTWAPHRLRNSMILDQFYDLLSCSSDQVEKLISLGKLASLQLHELDLHTKFMLWEGSSLPPSFLGIFQVSFTLFKPNAQSSPLSLHGCVSYFIKEWRPPNVICISFLLYLNH